MSWVKSLNSVSQDVFDEDTDDITLQTKEWNHNMEKRIKDGYRDGIDAGKEATLQLSFNEGFREGANRMKAIGQMKGILSALLCWSQQEGVGSSASAPISALMQDVVRHEEMVLEALKKAQERPVPSVGDVSEDLEDLEIAMNQEPSSKPQPQSQEQCCSRSDCCKADMLCGGHQPAISSSSHAIVGLEELVTRCVALATERGLPEELICHIEHLKTQRR